jgi:hypothetical protein
MVLSVPGHVRKGLQSSVFPTYASKCNTPVYAYVIQAHPCYTGIFPAPLLTFVIAFKVCKY